MNKKVYIIPAVAVLQLHTADGILQAGSPASITGNGSNSFSDAEEGTSGEKAGVKGAWDIWE